MEPITTCGEYIDSLLPVNVIRLDGSIDQGFMKNGMVNYQDPQMTANIIAELQNLRKRILLLENK